MAARLGATSVSVACGHLIVAGWQRDSDATCDTRVSGISDTPMSHVVSPSSLGHSLRNSNYCLNITETPYSKSCSFPRWDAPSARLERDTRISMDKANESN